MTAVNSPEVKSETHPHPRQWSPRLLEYWLFVQTGQGTNVVTHSLALEHAMKPRIDFYTASPDALKAMIALETAVSKLPLEKNLIELVKLRTSQINGCAFCLDMHSADALKGGESERRLATLSAWRETPFFTERERAALAWTESLTLISQTHAPDEDYELATAQFDAKELVDLTVAITTINAWNRLAIGFRKMPQA
jgi:AhpD family alkylhydroperoxidase